MSHAVASRVRHSKNTEITAIYHLNMLIENSPLYEIEISFMETESFDEELSSV